MTLRARRRAYTLVCVSVSAVAVALVARGDETEPSTDITTAARTTRPDTRARAHRRQQPAPRHEPEVARPASPSSGRDPSRARRRDRIGSSAFLRREGPRVLEAARRFVAAFSAYDAGNRDDEVIRALRAVSTPGLISRLLGAPAARVPPTMDRAPPPATVVALAPAFDQPPTAALVRVRSRREGHQSVGGIVVVSTDGRWRVSRLTG